MYFAFPNNRRSVREKKRHSSLVALLCIYFQNIYLCEQNGLKTKQYELMRIKVEWESCWHVISMTDLGLVVDFLLRLMLCFDSHALCCLVLSCVCLNVCLVYVAIGIVFRFCLFNHQTIDCIVLKSVKHFE